MSAAKEPQAARRPRVGLASSFTAHYRSVQVIRRFLERVGFEVVSTPRTTPEILRAGTTLASADFCVPLRVYVGHVHYLLQRRPDLDFIVAPNVCREDRVTSTCSKYRDIGGVAYRSFAGAIPYTVGTANPVLQRRWRALTGEGDGEAANEYPAGGLKLPVLLQPDIWSLEETSLFNVCHRLYADIAGISRGRRAVSRLAPGGAGRWLFPEVDHVWLAFRAAYDEVMAEERDPAAVERFLADESRPRLAVLGREYLVNDPIVTTDLLPYFRKNDVAVLTPGDVPFSMLWEGYRRGRGFYDTHRRYQAFVDAFAGRVDGFVLVASFGCHPDGFMMDYLVEKVREYGVAAWVLKYDETSGGAGFQTRYETMLGFLRERAAARRLHDASIPVSPHAKTANPEIAHTRADEQPINVIREPIIIWPHMNEIVDLVVEEVFWQAGLSRFLVRPEPASQETIALGDIKYIDTCSPFALTTGSLRQSIEKVLLGLEAEEARTGRTATGRRIILLQGRGEGPCTYGWYAITQAEDLPRLYADRLARGGHTMEMASMGLVGIGEFLEQMSRIGNSQHLLRLAEFIQQNEEASATAASRHQVPGVLTEGGLSARLAKGWRQMGRSVGFVRALDALTHTGWAKLHAAEDLRARSLIIRAHELERGATTHAYREGIELLRAAHSRRDVILAHRGAKRLLARVPADRRPLPRIAVVGEIYVSLSSFANRGTIENLVGREKLEVVEGVSLGDFLRHTLHELRRRLIVGAPGVRTLVAFLARRNIRILAQRPRDEKARPFLGREVGGDGLLSAARARTLIEDGVDGVLHVFPFKCMPEGIAKDALTEMTDFYGVRYLPLSFGKEMEIERLKTEVTTFAAILHAQLASATGSLAPGGFYARIRWWFSHMTTVLRRRRLGRLLTVMHDSAQARLNSR